MSFPSVSAVPSAPPSSFALFALGFRPFFLGAGILSIVATSIWTAVLLLGLSWPNAQLAPMQWHGHEMVFGYALAVIGGFLLTAVRNWTNVQTLRGGPLAALFTLWLAARIALLFGGASLWPAALLDVSFSLFLIAAVAHPIIKVRQWHQMFIVAILTLLALCNVAFYLGALRIWAPGTHIGIYGGMFMVVGLILTMGRRVVPFFIENGVDERVTLRNSKLLDIASIVLFLLFAGVELFTDWAIVSGVLAITLFMLHASRLLGWHTAGIWRKRLLWSLYLPFWFITLGFLLFAGASLFGTSKMVAIHAFTFGGIGAVTLSMMSRVSLGHTGRNVGEPPKTLSLAFFLVLSGAAIRVAGPLLDAGHYAWWIGASQLLWLGAFLVFVAVIAPMLIRPRVDGRPG